MSDFEITQANPRDPRVRALVERHLAFGRSFTPLEDAHALEADELLDPSIVLFAASDGEEILAVGALKEIEDGHGELKTMHTAGPPAVAGSVGRRSTTCSPRPAAAATAGSVWRPGRWTPSPPPALSTKAPASPPASPSAPTAEAPTAST